MAASTVVIVFAAVSIMLLSFFQAGFRVTFSGPNQMKEDPEEQKHLREEAEQKEPDMSTHPFAGLARCIVLASGPNRPTSLLVAHDSRDKLCPCYLPSCAGALVAGVAALNVISMVVRFFVASMSVVLMVWTPLATLATATFGHVWSAIIAVIFGTFCSFFGI